MTMLEARLDETGNVNIARMMIPKAMTDFLHTTDSVRQGLELMSRHGYTAIPVLDGEDHYVTCVTEGDFLRHVLAKGTDMRANEKHRIDGIVRPEFCPSLQISATLDQLIASVMNQNFVPIVDGRGCFCGIVTRRAVIELLARYIRMDNGQWTMDNGQWTMDNFAPGKPR